MLNVAWLRQLQEWITEHRQKLFLLGGFLVVGALAFEGGLLKGATLQSAPLVVSLPAVVTPSVSAPGALIEESRSGKNTTPSVMETAQPSAGTCPFVGSVNSDKYHLATCAVVKRIKPENRVCFASKEEAEKRGYKPSCMQ